ncbi:hypothetical protein K1T71_001601 [Dendrolimus kikuchii]|uniref:Uncharacterized protein n=1 Tax=Dendrolimus kikuchii TaxID=765133 RepID=A0ACC1DF59_9NEOP|nr:hypothetical protein K1T71_001601 [Dendrolimus kikuchii]
MTPLLFVGLFVAASAAPQFFNRNPPFPHHRHLSPYFQDDIFNTENFWSGLSRELQQLDNMLAEFHNRFPTTITREGIQGNEYKITIPLSGFDEKDIVVKAREGLLMVQAVHKDEVGNENNYLNIRNLPNYVNVTGRWTYENGVLKVVFPVKAGSEHSVEETTNDTTPVAITTEGYTEQSREELESSREANTVNADVGLERGDQERDRHLLTNEIPRNSVEATTYAVDLKDEVEFVPVRY